VSLDPGDGVSTCVDARSPRSIRYCIDSIPYRIDRNNIVSMRYHIECLLNQCDIVSICIDTILDQLNQSMSSLAAPLLNMLSNNMLSNTLLFAAPRPNRMLFVASNRPSNNIAPEHGVTRGAAPEHAVEHVAVRGVPAEQAVVRVVAPEHDVVRAGRSRTCRFRHAPPSNHCRVT
jgi:hypothetical protein